MSERSRPLNYYSKAGFRRYLNQKHGVVKLADRHCGRRTGAKKRPYGDYLYAQDREMFNAEYVAWLESEGYTHEGAMRKAWGPQ